MRTYTIAVIYNEVDIAGQTAIQGVIDSAVEVRNTLAALGHQVSLLRVDEGIRPFVDALEGLRPDVVFNMCEGYRDSSAGEYHIAGLLELLGIPYTGSGPVALALALDKPLSKELFCARGIPTPRFVVYRQVPDGLPPVAFPLMLKLAGEDASVGITSDNVVRDEPSFRKRMQELLHEYEVPVLAEEYIEGREFTIAVFDGRPLLVEEIQFDVEPRIVSFNAKWDSGSSEYDGTNPTFAPVISDKERHQMMALATRVWDLIGMRDYARVDFRMDAEGRIYVLEANPNPDISVGSGYRLALDAAKIPYVEFVTRLVQNAFERRATK
jgi:D-alanine-D-alanine ligase